jgi:TPR repeat protein
MLTSSRILRGLVAGAAFAAAPALALDGTPTPGSARPVAAIQQGAVALKNAIPPVTFDNSLTSLQYAADGGHPVAQWKLGRMYALGDGVAQDKMRAFEYFSQVANAHADDSPLAPQAPVIANAFVSLGLSYLDGIPDSRVKSDPERAREMFTYAASYFGDANAQYQLARLYLRGIGAPRDPKSAARWLGLAAQKNQPQAQALLGQMLFYGTDMQRQAARGLMLLTLARDGAGSDEAWIKDIYTAAIQKASDDDRAMALQMLQRWLQGRRD